MSCMLSIIKIHNSIVLFNALWNAANSAFINGVKEILKSQSLTSCFCTSIPLIPKAPVEVFSNKSEFHIFKKTASTIASHLKNCWSRPYRCLLLQLLHDYRVHYLLLMLSSISWYNSLRHNIISEAILTSCVFCQAYKLKRITNVYSIQ